MDRRRFLKQLSIVSGGIALSGILPACTGANSFDFEISLAEWSLHKSLFSNKISNLDFPVIASQKYDIKAIEYVNQFFKDKAKDTNYLKELQNRCDEEGVKSVLIMVDQEGHLAAKDENERNKAVENHFKWVDAAKQLGCHSIRVNLHGDGDEQEWVKASADGLAKLAEYGKANDLNIIVENHGQLSSKGYLLVEVMQQVDSPYVGTLPDFGNFCVRRRDGDLWESPCVEWYDRYKGVEEMMPYAKGLSAKSFAFDEAGNDTTSDFKKMLSIAQDYNYKGYVGIEYEGENTPEEEGIRKTKALLEKVRKELKG